MRCTLAQRPDPSLTAVALKSRMGRYTRHYEALFRNLQARHGRLDKKIVSSVVGFSGGGPVSMSTLEKKGIYVTCELSLYPEQKRSEEGLKFELLSLGPFDLLACRVLLTAIGNISMHETLGHDHTIDVGKVMEPGQPSVVKLRLFSECEIGGEKFGVYQVVPEHDEALDRQQSRS